MLNMLLPTTLLAFIALGADDGQGPVVPDAHVDQLDAGRYVFGTNFDYESHLGEVVLVVFGGS